MIHGYTMTPFFTSSRGAIRSGTGVFTEFNKKGIFTAVAGFCVVAGAVVYLVALYSVFHTSFLLERVDRDSKEISQKILVLELELQKREGDFSDGKLPEFKDMEKVSSMRYIGGEQATAFLSSPPRE